MLTFGNPCFLRTTFCFLLAFATVTSAAGQQGNSTRKERIKPGSVSSKCGTAIQWRSSVSEALQESAESSRPVLWYVPTLNGSFMDRKPVIDQYMMAGPFSWPAIASLVNDHFIPVRAVADARLQTRFAGIKPYRFVEPGLIIIRADGSVQATVDQITTLDPYWILSLLSGWVEAETPLLWKQLPATAIEQFRAGQTPDLSGIADDATDVRVEKDFLTAMIQFRGGDRESAIATWQGIVEYAPDHPLAWKAAAEAENWGPFIRGFEVHRQLPDQAYRAGIASRGSAAPADLYSEAETWMRSVDFLLGMQGNHGGWVDSDYDFGGTDSLPNVHVAVTALCGNALLEGLDRLPERKESVSRAILAAAAYCDNEAMLNRNDRDEILWAHAYRVRFFANLVSRNDEFRQTWFPALTRAVADLESIQTNRGTWYHEYANSFVTATALTALHLADKAGATVDQEKIRRGVASLANDRFDNGSYPYYGQETARQRGTPRSSGEGKIPESAGRMPLCELALWQWGASSDERLQFALNAALDNHKYLAVSYKYDNHTSTMGYGGFFFWYDMRSRAEAILFYTDRSRQLEMAARHRKLVMQLPELDGCFVDSHELGRCYGTAMALLTLSHLDDIPTQESD